MKRKPTESKLGSGDGSMSLSQEAESKATPPTIANIKLMKHGFQQCLAQITVIIREMERL